MKTPQNRIGKLVRTLVIGGCLAAPAMLTAEDSTPPAGPPPPRERMESEDIPQDRRMNRVRGQIEALHRLGKHDEAMQLERRLRGAVSGGGMMMPPDGKPGEARPKIRAERGNRPEPGKMIPAKVKIQHLHRAAMSLQAAGYQEQADKARHEIGRLEAEARQMEEAKRQPDASADMHGEIKKMRKEMEELRQQVRKLKAEATSKPKPQPDSAPPHSEMGHP